MATTYWADTQGRYYSSTTGALSANDQQLQNVSANGAAVITTTPTLKDTVEGLVKQKAISDHSIWGSQVKLH